MLKRRRTDGARSTQYSAALLAEGLTKPGGWVYEIADGYDPDGAVPPEAIKGAWKIGEDGVPTGAYEPNPNFKPVT